MTKRGTVVVRKARLLDERPDVGRDTFSINTRPFLWQPHFVYNNPLLFVIPSEAEGSAVLRTLPGSVDLNNLEFAG
jgi:hypothetical protein